MLGLSDVDTIEEVDKAKRLEWKVKVVVDEVEENLAGGWRRCSAGKIVALPHEEDTLVIDDTRVEAWFMNSWSEA